MNGELITIILTIIGTGVGATYIFSKDIKELAKDMKKEFREDMKEHKEEMAEIDKRWTALFEKFHIFDKDMEKFRTKNQINRRKNNA